VDVILDYDAHILMAGRAGQRDIPAVDKRIGIVDFPDVVLTVAVPAFGHFLITPLQIGFAVNAIRVREGIETGTDILVVPVAGRRAARSRYFLGVRQIAGSFPWLDDMAVRAAEPAVD
jgi:hypothetical protein